jgi:DNA-binding HxlR family transcriptional regulator
MPYEEQRRFEGGTMQDENRVEGPRSGRSITALLDLLGRRWSLRVLWELSDGPLTSRALRAACDEASPTVLQRRLTELRGAGLVSLERGRGYALTALGKELYAGLGPLRVFAERWTERWAAGAGPPPREDVPPQPGEG